MHRFLVHQSGDHVGVAVADIAAGETITGLYVDDESTVELAARQPIPLGHKVAIRACEAGDPVLKYGIQIGRAPKGFQTGEHVHVHNLESARW